MEIYPGNASRTVYQHVALLERVADELEGIFEMRGHPVAGQIEGIDYFMVDLLFLRVRYPQHGCCSQH